MSEKFYAPLSNLLRDKVFKNADIVHRIFAACEAGDMLHFGSMDRAAHESLKEYMLSAYNFDRILSHFVPDTKQFRELQCQTATLISGSQALHFFDRTFDLTAPLDLFLFPGREKEIGEYLLSIGYKLAPSRDQLSTLSEEIARPYEPDLRPWRPYTSGKRPYNALKVYQLWECTRRSDSLLLQSGILRLYCFTRPDDRRLRVSPHIRLFVSSDSPIASILRYLPSTALLNVISHDTAYSLYPHDTFVERKQLKIGLHTGDEEPSWKSHVSSRWENITYQPHETPELKAELVERWIDDANCWIIPIRSSNSVGSAPSSLDLNHSQPETLNPVALSGWSLYPSMGHDMWLIESTCVVGEMLNYSYVTPMTVQPQLDVLKCKSSAELLEACEEDHNDCSACVDRQLMATIASDRKNSDRTPSDLMFPGNCCLQ